MDVKFYRGDEIGREPRKLPADLYNLIHLLFARNGGQDLFIPIRSMQYLATIDDGEVIFVDGTAPSNIELAWCEFQAGKREDLRAPVTYTCIYYREQALDIMNRLQVEFQKALEQVQSRKPKPKGASVTPLDSR